MAGVPWTVDDTEETPWAVDDTTPEARYAEQRKTEAEAVRAQQRSTAGSVAVGLSDVPMRIVESAGQGARAVGEYAGVLPEGTTRDYTSELTLRRYLKTGDDSTAEMAADLGEFATFLLPVGAPVLGASKAARIPGLRQAFQDPTRFWQAIRQGAARGAGFGFAGQGATEGQYIEAADVLTGRALGTALGGVGGAVAAIPRAVLGGGRNLMVRAMQNAGRNRETVRLLRNRIEDMELSLSQRTGSPLFKRLEVQVQALRAQEFYNEQLYKFYQAQSNFLAGMEQAAGGSISQLDLGRRITSAYGRSRDAMFSEANNLYGQRLAVAADLAGQDMVAPVAMANAAQTAARWNEELGGTWWRKLHPGAERLAPEFKALEKAMLGENGFQHMSFDELVKLRRSLNNMDKPYYDARGTAKGPTDAQIDQHRAVSDMRKAVDADIDAFLAANQGSDRGAVQALNEMRDANVQYREFRDYAKQMDQTAVSYLFKGEVPLDPGKNAQILMGMEPAQQRLAIDMLRQHDPEAAQHLKTFLVRDAFLKMSASGAERSGTVAPFDPVAWRSAITDKYGRVMGEELFSAGELEHIGKSLNTIRLMANAPIMPGGEAVLSVQRAVEPEGFLMAVVSVSSAFLARVAVRMNIGLLEDVLFTPEGRRALETIVASKGKYSKTAERALGVLTAKMARADQQQVQQEGEFGGPGYANQ